MTRLDLLFVCFCCWYKALEFVSSPKFLWHTMVDPLRDIVAQRIARGDCCKIAKYEVVKRKYVMSASPSAWLLKLTYWMRGIAELNRYSKDAPSAPNTATPHSARAIQDHQQKKRTQPQSTYADAQRTRHKRPTWLVDLVC